MIIVWNTMNGRFLVLELKYIFIYTYKLQGTLE